MDHLYLRAEFTLVGDDGEFHQDAKPVDAVDTTAAGDTFNGILATCLSEGASLREAMIANGRA